MIIDDIFGDMETDIQSIIDTGSSELISDFKLTAPVAKETPDDTAIEVVAENSSEIFERDFDYIRKNLKDIIASGSMALDQMILVAQTSEHPRAFEVVATLMKTLAEVNKDLLTAHKNRDERTVTSGGTTSTTNVQNNTVFVGSTSELSKLIKERKKETGFSAKNTSPAA